MTAIVLHDMGAHRESTRWFHTAGRAAAESGDRDLHAWVLGREAMVSLNFGAAAVAGQITERARAVAAGRATAATALVTVVAARAHAARGDRAAAPSAIDEAEGLLSRLPSDQAADTWLGYPEQKHHVHLSQALTLLGETRRAYASQDRALQLSRRPSVMTRSLIALDRAACLAHNGERGEAARIAGRAYGELPAAHRQGLTRARARSVYEAVSGNPDAQLLREAPEAAA
ncbi:hypothetical protein [Streptomyces sp. MP131-18]|uniref:hypothetical protein n=1 Tax=Streptomyces sp. MP131-18 TaxID=1857892 RepID=UPI0009C81A12|nr:hypothetical protein [Streptomyces sp. MP131-18]ONK15468.1 hypothetical protein STBA_62850 [Streptomyces sp. MP131-18]